MTSEIFGTNQAENINGSDADEIIYGYEGNDVIEPGNGDDTIDAGKGDDVIGGSSGNAGNDTYIYKVGDGKDTIYESTVSSSDSNGSDILELSDISSQSAVLFSASGDDLVIKIRNSSNDSITIKNQFRSNADKIETIKFSNGTTLDISSITTSDIAQLNSSYLSNNAPTANLVYAETLEDSSIFLDVLSNTSDVDRDIFTISTFTQPSYGTVVFQNGNLLYTPYENVNGYDTFSYTVTDERGASVTKEVTINVVSVVDPAAIYTWAYYTKVFYESNDSLDVVSNFINNPDNQEYSISIKRANGGSLSSWLTYDEVNQQIRGTSNSDSNSFERVELKISDASGQTLSSIKFNIIYVKSINMDPSANLIESVNGLASASQGTKDFLKGTANSDQFEYTADSTWTGNTKAYNPFTKDVVQILGKKKSYDAFDGGEGYDVINLSSEDDVLFLDDNISESATINGTRISNIELISAGDGDDVVDLSSRKVTYGSVTIMGGSGNDVLWSNDGDDYIDGGEGDDHIVGGRGHDTLYGGDGDDIIKGFHGRDILVGGNGSDTLSGGFGADTFTYYSLTESTNTSYDTITDFQKDIDLISLSGLGFTGITSDTSNSDASILTYRFESNQTIIENSDKTFLIKLDGTFNLDSGDFNF